MNSEEKQRLKDAEDIIWTVIQKYGYVNIYQPLYDLADEYFRKYGTELLEEDDE